MGLSGHVNILFLLILVLFISDQQEEVLGPFQLLCLCLLPTPTRGIGMRPRSAYYVSIMWDLEMLAHRGGPAG